MKFENEELDKETLDRLESYGIFLSRDAPPVNKEKVLVLVGEAMLDRFVKEFVSLWKNELFPHCLLRDYEASAKEVHKMIHPDEPWDESTTQQNKDSEGDTPSEGSESYSNHCKEVDKKMDENTKARMDEYVSLLNKLQQQVGDEKALTILQEIKKDERVDRMHGERSFNGDLPATENQIAFLKNLGAVIPEGLTRQQASKLIEDTKAAIRQMDKAGKVPVRVP